LSIITVAVLLSPVLAFLMAIAVEILIGLLVEAGTPVLLVLITTGAVGWLLFRKLRRRPEATPIET
jgi:positive regulator of sigma E activity